MIRRDQTRPDVIDDSMIGGTAGWDRVGLGLTGREPEGTYPIPGLSRAMGSKRLEA